MIYLVLAVVAVRVVTGTSQSGRGGEQVTAKVLQLPGGQVLVALAGVVIVAAAVLLAWRGVADQVRGAPGPVRAWPWGPVGGDHPG